MTPGSLEIASGRKVRLLFIGKYPPIQGGESAKLYWLARFLGGRGHEIVVVSNFSDIAPHDKVPFGPGSEAQWIPKNVFAFSTEKRTVPAFVSRYDPQVEKLTSLGLRVASKARPDIIIGWYLLPYAVAAYNVSQILGIPLIVQHAGSDLARLLPDPQLNEFLTAVLKSTTMVLTYPSSHDFLTKLGCRNIRVHRPAICNDFAPDGPIMDLESLGVKSKNVLLFLGKASKGKGLELLINAFRHAHTDACLVIAAGGQHLDRYKRMVKEQDLDERIRFVTMVPPWKVPELIRSANAVVVPEFNFGVKAHRSRIPLEALLCGRIPLVSAEIASFYAPWAPYLENVRVDDRDSFAASITRIMNGKHDAERRRTMASEVRNQENFEKYACGLEEMFLNVSSS